MSGPSVTQEWTLISDRASQQDTRTYREMRHDERVPAEIIEERLVDETLGLIAQTLIRRGDTETASILGRISRTELAFVSDQWGDAQDKHLFAEYEPEDADDFLRAEDMFCEVFWEIVRRTSFPLDGFHVRADSPDRAVRVARAAERRVEREASDQPSSEGSSRRSPVP